MNFATKTFQSAGVTFLLATQQTVSFAQSQGLDVSYQPLSPTSVPTLSEWGMIALSALLIVVAFFTLRGKKGGTPLAAIVLASSLVLGSIGGMNVMSEAHAVGGGTICSSPSVLCSASSASGGTITVLTTSADVEIKNNSGVAQKITGVVAKNPPDDNDEPLFDNSKTPRCMTLPVLQPLGSCWVNNRPSGSPAG